MLGSYIDKQEVPCMTNRELNIRTIRGVLSINLLKESYWRNFDGGYTSATIISRQSFKLDSPGTNLLFEIKASLLNYNGTYPQIFLMPEGYYSHDHRMTMFNFKENTLWYGLDKYQIAKRSEKDNITKEIDLEQFHNYQFEFTDKKFKWRLDDQDHLFRGYFLDTDEVGKTGFLLNPYFSLFKGVAPLKPYKIVVTVFHDIDNPSDINDKYCHSLLLDYIRVYSSNGTNFDINTDTSSLNNSSEICKTIISKNDQTYVKFRPNQDLKLIWQDEFDHNYLDLSKWSIQFNENRCRGRVHFYLIKF